LVAAFELSVIGGVFLDGIVGQVDKVIADVVS
jgi:hypothetical protein